MARSRYITVLEDIVHQIDCVRGDLSDGAKRRPSRAERLAMLDEALSRASETLMNAGVAYIIWKPRRVKKRR